MLSNSFSKLFLPSIQLGRSQEILEANKVDLILMDISLQNSMDGLEITKALKASIEYKHIPVIAATAHALERDHQAVIAAGCDDYLAKPFSKGQLLLKIDKFISNNNSTLM